MVLDKLNSLSSHIIHMKAAISWMQPLVDLVSNGLTPRQPRPLQYKVNFSLLAQLYFDTFLDMLKGASGGAVHLIQQSSF